MITRATRAMHQWRKERPDLDPFPMCVLGSLAEASLLINRDHLNPLIASNGLQSGEFDVLVTLRRSGAPFTLTPTELYETMMISSGGMTNRIDHLEKADLIERRKHPTDRRGTLVALTDKGLSLINEIIVTHVENQKKVLRPLDQNEQQELNRLLDKLLAGLDVSNDS